MKRILIFVLVLVLLASVFVCSVSAASYDPIYSTGYTAYSGFWSLMSSQIYGTFQLHYSLTDIVSKEFALIDPCEILYDERDADGNGICYWILYVPFSNGFAVDSRYIEYHTLKVVFREYDSNGVGYLNDLVVIADFGEAGLFRYYPDGASEYFEDSYLFFGEQGSQNYPALSDNVFRWMRMLFSDPFMNGSIASVGLFKPVVYTGGAGPGGGGSGGGFPGGSEGDTPEIDAESGFTRFAELIFDFFRDLLSISFFGSFFTLGDLVGIVFALGLLTMFLKWFAGG